VIWVTVFQSTLLFASSGGVLKMDVVCFLRAVSIPSYFVSVWKGTIPMPFGLNEVMKLKWDRVWCEKVILGE
jgi:hypothetical protein